MKSNTTVYCGHRKIAALNLQIPITIVLDNARYQKCKIVSELATLLNIELMYLPAYSPNLKFQKSSNYDGVKYRSFISAFDRYPVFGTRKVCDPCPQPV